LVTSYAASVRLSVKSTSVNYTVLDTDGFDVVNVTTGASGVSVTLPSAASNTGRKLTIKKIDSGAGFLDIATAGSTIDGATTTTLIKQGSFLALYCDGTGWFVEACSDWIRLDFSSTITTTNTSQAGIGIPSGRWTVVGGVASVGGNGTTKALDLNITTSPGGTGTFGVDRFFPAFNSSYMGASFEIQPIRLTATITSYYISIATLDSGSAPSTSGFIMAKRIG
jgi:hypothetical protein